MKPEVRLVLAAVRASLPEDDADIVDEDFVHVVFMNPRENAEYSNGMRLTREGVVLLSGCFDHYALNLEDDWDTRDMLFLDRRCAFPYFLGSKEIIIFDKVWAMRIRLHGSLRRLRLAME